MNLIKELLIVVFILSLLSCGEAKVNSGKNSFYIQNHLPRLDTDGNVVDAHDGRVVQFGDKYYWYGTKYGNTNGFTEANHYVVYSSDDLKEWVFEGRLIREQPTGVYYRPHVVYNSQTEKYVLWYNWYPQLWDGQFGVAQSDSPTGPFEIVNDNVAVKYSELGVGDFGIFVDRDGAAYLSYNTIQGHRLSIEKLSSDYLTSSLENSGFMAEHVEAGSMFERNGIYYLLTDWTCCFCNQGAGARVYMAESPMGPYQQKGNINRFPGIPTPILQNGLNADNFFEEFLAKKGHWIELWQDGEGAIEQLEIVQFTGDRKGQCGEVDNPRVHELIPELSFEIEYFLDGAWYPIQPKVQGVRDLALRKIHRFELEIGQAEALRLKPKFETNESRILLSEIKINDSGTGFSSFKSHEGLIGKVIIPAQQTYVMDLQVNGNTQFIWMGDLWGSASDQIKGHDYQFWSEPLHFYSDGSIRRMRWKDEFEIN